MSWRETFTILSAATYHMGICGVCKQFKSVTEPRDFNYPNFADAPEVPYSSIPETQEHVYTVTETLNFLANKIEKRGPAHDASKMTEPELSHFNVYTPKLKGLVFGSPEYKASLKELGVALKHHYEHNRHHPEHFENGIEGMTLVDLVEMFADWEAASRRTKDGNVLESIRKGKKRFKMCAQLAQIFENTAKELLNAEEPHKN